MKAPSQWEKAGVIAAIAGVAVSIISVVVAAGWPNQSEFCIVANYSSGHPASDTVLVHSKDKPIIADNFGRFICHAKWLGNPAVVCDQSGRPLFQIPALLPDAKVEIGANQTGTQNKEVIEKHQDEGDRKIVEKAKPAEDRNESSSNEETPIDNTTTGQIKSSAGSDKTGDSRETPTNASGVNYPISKAQTEMMKLKKDWEIASTPPGQSIIFGSRLKTFNDKCAGKLSFGATAIGRSANPFHSGRYCGFVSNGNCLENLWNHVARRIIRTFSSISPDLDYDVQNPKWCNSVTHEFMYTPTSVVQRGVQVGGCSIQANGTNRVPVASQSAMVRNTRQFFTSPNSLACVALSLR